MMAFALAYAGFTALCLAMDRHHEQVFRRRLAGGARRRALSAAGYALLAAALLPPVAGQGWGLGVVLWVGVLTGAALPLALLLCYAPRAVPVLPPLLLAAGLVSLLA